MGGEPVSLWEFSYAACPNRWHTCRTMGPSSAPAAPQSAKPLRGTCLLTGRPIEVRFRGDGAIASVTSCLAAPPHVFLAPGLVDVQLNGFVGFDFNVCGSAGPEKTAAGLSRVCEHLHASGVTTFLPTLITGAPGAIAASLAALAAARALLPPRLAACVPGFHLEGPFINPADGYRGAHPAAHCAPPDLALLDRWQEAAGGLIKYVTLAPELPGALEFIRGAVARGVAVAIGHTAANAEQVAAAAAAGATLSTHLGNGVPLQLHRHANPLWAQLGEDRLAAGFIADTWHLPPEVLRAALRAKGHHRSFLVSDAAAPGGLPPGEFEGSAIGGGVVLTGEPGGARPQRLAMKQGGYLAGSAATLLQAVAHAAELVDDERGFSAHEGAAARRLARAWALASVNPARLLALPHAAALSPGAPANMVELMLPPADGGGGASPRVTRVWVLGEEVFPRAVVDN
jgi:N-acetylglucosamine-6-phosphate deacetylase